MSDNLGYMVVVSELIHRHIDPSAVVINEFFAKMTYCEFDLVISEPVGRLPRYVNTQNVRSRCTHRENVRPIGQVLAKRQTSEV